MKKLLSILLLCFCFSATAQNSTVICIDPLANNYFALMDTLSDTWNTSYFNPDSDVYVDSFYDDYSYGDSTEACTYDFGCTNPLAFNFNPEANVNDGTCEYDIMTQLNQSFDAWNVSINLQEGWNMFGYGCPNPIDMVEGFSNHTGSIGIVKDNNGSVYMPDFGFNGIGDFTPGFGYQIKLSDAIEDLRLCDWYVNDFPEGDIVSLQDEVISLTEENTSLQEDLAFMSPYFGCMDTIACNYDSSALLDDESCTYAEQGYDCNGITLITQGNINAAVDAWLLNPGSTETIYGHLSDWDVSNVTDMSYLFFYDANFTSDLSGWDVSNVTSMYKMFSSADSFTSDLSSWDVSNVTNMGYMFNQATSFTSDLSSWDVSNVTNMGKMFYNATSFTNDLSSWDVSNVTSMVNIFLNTGLSIENQCAIQESFSTNQNWPYDWTSSYCDCLLDTDAEVCNISLWDFNINHVIDVWILNPDSTEIIYGHISSWDVSNVTDMSYVFYGADNFNEDISGWDVSNVTNMRSMFNFADNFNEDISGWDVSNVTNMDYMFSQANSFTRNLSSWDVSNVTNMGYMFNQATSFTSDLSGWDVSNVTNMYKMFNNADSLTSDLSSWVVSNVTDMGYMFYGANNFNDDISSWDVSNVTSMGHMFYYATSFTSDLSGWDVSNVTNMGSMFYQATSFTSDLSGWNVSNVTSMGYMFYYASSFTSDLSSWNVSNVASMSSMFTFTGLSIENQCAIQESFSTNENWPYDWCE